MSTKGWSTSRTRRARTHQACSKRPSFGFAETEKVEFCSEHAKQGMIDLIRKKCAHRGAPFGVAGALKRSSAQGMQLKRWRKWWPKLPEVGVAHKVALPQAPPRPARTVLAETAAQLPIQQADTSTNPVLIHL